MTTITMNKEQWQWTMITVAVENDNNDNEQWQQCTTMRSNLYNENFIIIHCSLLLQHCNSLYNIVIGIVDGLPLKWWYKW